MTTEGEELLDYEEEHQVQTADVGHQIEVQTADAEQQTEATLHVVVEKQLLAIVEAQATTIKKLSKQLERQEKQAADGQKRVEEAEKSANNLRVELREDQSKHRATISDLNLKHLRESFESKLEAKSHEVQRAAAHASSKGLREGFSTAQVHSLAHRSVEHGFSVAAYHPPGNLPVPILVQPPPPPRLQYEERKRSRDTWQPSNFGFSPSRDPRGYRVSEQADEDEPF